MISYSCGLCFLEVIVADTPKDPPGVPPHVNGGQWNLLCIPSSLLGPLPNTHFLFSSVGRAMTHGCYEYFLFAHIVLYLTVVHLLLYRENSVFLGAIILYTSASGYGSLLLFVFLTFLALVFLVISQLIINELGFGSGAVVEWLQKFPSLLPSLKNLGQNRISGDTLHLTPH